jgi:hemerythrin-like domain-containing protein
LRAIGPHIPRVSSLFQLGAKPPPDYTDPVAFLGACHRRIEAQFAALERIVAALRSGDEAQVVAARVAVVDPLKFFAEAGARHALDEDASVFPRIQHPGVIELASEHREHEAMYLALRTVGSKVAAGDVDARLVDDLELHARAMKAAYAEHIRFEEEEIFPLVAALDAKELRAIGIEMRIRRGGAAS